MAFSPKLGIWGFGRRLAKDHPIFTSIGWILASLRGSPLPLEQLDPRIPRYRLCWCSGVGVCSGLSYFNTDAGISAGCIRICSFWCGKVSKMENLWKFPQNVAWHIFVDWNLAINLVKPNNMKVSRFVMVGIRDFCVKISQILFASPDLWLWQIGTMTVTGPISGLAVCGSQEVKNALVQKIRGGRQLRR